MKALILAAGYGSRFFPVSKSVPKEMLPIYNIPSIQFVIDEILDASIKDVIVITSRRKKVLEDYFDIEVELENFFSGTKYIKLLEPPNLNVSFIRQHRMSGVGDAILLATSLIGDDSFILFYPDDIVISKPSLSKRLIDAFERTGKSILSILDKRGEDVSRFGVVKVDKRDEYFDILDIVEKPPRGSEPSKYVTIGRYLFSSEFLYLLKKEHESFSGVGEFYHISSIRKLCNDKRVIGIEVDSETFFDTGTPLEYAKSFIKYSLIHSHNKEEIKLFLTKYYNK